MAIGDPPGSGGPGVAGFADARDAQACLVALAITVVVQPITVFGRRQSTASAGIAHQFVDLSVAVIVRAIAGLVWRNPTLAALVQNAFTLVGGAVAIVIGPITNFVDGQSGLFASPQNASATHPVARTTSAYANGLFGPRITGHSLALVAATALFDVFITIVVDAVAALFSGARMCRAPRIVAVRSRLAVLSEAIPVEILTTHDLRIRFGLGIRIGLGQHLATAAASPWILGDFAAVVTAIGSQQQDKQKTQREKTRLCIQSEITH